VDRQITNGSCQSIAYQERSVSQEMMDGVSGLGFARMPIDIDQELCAGVAGKFGGELRRWLTRMCQQSDPRCVRLIPADVSRLPVGDPQCAWQEFFQILA
jgi:hypothetical protein